MLKRWGLAAGFRATVASASAGHEMMSNAMIRVESANLAWKAYAGFGAFLLLSYLIVPASMRIWLYDSLTIATAIAIAVAIRLRHPGRPLGWALLSAGLFLTAIGDLTWTYYVHLGQEPFPSLADAGYLGGVFTMAAALFVLARDRTPRRDFGAQVDSVIIAIGCGLLAWVFLMAPYAADTSLSVFGRSIAILYPVLDIMMLSVLARLMFAAGARCRSLDLLALGMVGWLTADTVYGYMALTGVYSDGSAVDLGWMFGFTLFGASALHPSMTSLTRRTAREHSPLSTRRLGLLAGATLLAPVSLSAQWLRQEPMSTPVIAAGSAVLFLLVLGRLNGLVTIHRRAEIRERTLRRAGAGLGAAITHEEIANAAERAAEELAEGKAAAVRVTFGSASAIQPGGPSHASALATTLESTGGKHHAIELDLSGSPELNEWLGTGAPATSAIIAPLVVHDEVQGFIAVTGSNLPADLLLSFESLASQAALAFESAALAEDLHRRRSESRFRALVQNAADIIMIATADGTITYASPSFAQLCGKEPATLTSANLLDFVHQADAFSLRKVLAVTEGSDQERLAFQIRLRDAGERWRWCEVRVNDGTGDPEIGGIVLTLRDVTERKALEDQLRHQAFHDPLTGLPNRALFHDRLAHGLARCGRTASSLAILFLDVDGFKTVNDSLGHGAGDELLMTLAQRFASSVRPGDTIARFGGDEFAVLLEGASIEVAISLADRLLLQMNRPIQLGDRSISVSVSIGIAPKTGPEATPEDLLRQADIAMYAAKRHGKARSAVFDPSMTERVWQRMVIESELRQALAQGELVVYYQPVIDLKSDQIVEVEALVRWNHPVHGLVAPGEFIPVAEETGLIIPIGWWVMEQACRQVLGWHTGESPETRIRLSVNLSPAMFHQSDIAEHVSRILNATGFPPSSLKLEITEGVMMLSGEETLEKLRQLKELGVRLAIDDFGTGYSSLAYLQTFPLDVIKIDRSFVASINENLESLAIVRMIIGLARSLNLEVTGEGIETAAQLAQLQALGSDLGQGFLFSQPVPESTIIELLAANAARPPVSADERLRPSFAGIPPADAP